MTDSYIKYLYNVVWNFYYVIVIIYYLLLLFIVYYYDLRIFVCDDLICAGLAVLCFHAGPCNRIVNLPFARVKK
jgi:hypothetical protein